MRADLGRYVDLQFLAVTTLVRNKDKLNELMRSVERRRDGVRPAQRHLLRLRHRPRADGGLGAVPEPVDHARVRLRRRLRQRLHRAEHAVPPACSRRSSSASSRSRGCCTRSASKITRDYAKILADDLFSPEVLFDGVLNGPGSDKLFALDRQGGRRGDRRAVRRRPPAGRARRRHRSATARSRRGWWSWSSSGCPTTWHEAQDYATSAIDLESTIVDKMNQLTNDEYEVDPAAGVQGRRAPDDHGRRHPRRPRRRAPGSCHRTVCALTKACGRPALSDNKSRQYLGLSAASTGNKESAEPASAPPTIRTP